jgi:hypothetical protein
VLVTEDCIFCAMHKNKQTLCQTKILNIYLERV